MKTAHDWVHTFCKMNACGVLGGHTRTCDMLTKEFGQLQVDALKFALANSAGMGIEDKIAELEREGS